jgi:hypothetical protein
MYGTTSAGFNVASLNAAAAEVATEHAVPRGTIKPKSKFPHLNSGSLRHCIMEENYF